MSAGETCIQWLNPRSNLKLSVIVDSEESPRHEGVEGSEKNLQAEGCKRNSATTNLEGVLVLYQVSCSVNLDQHS